MHCGICKLGQLPHSVQDYIVTSCRHTTVQCILFSMYKWMNIWWNYVIWLSIFNCQVWWRCTLEWVNDFGMACIHVMIKLTKHDEFSVSVLISTSHNEVLRPSSLQTRLSNSFSSIKILTCCLIFHRNLFPMAQLTINNHCSINRLAADKPLSEQMIA